MALNVRFEAKGGRSQTYVVEFDEKWFRVWNHHGTVVAKMQRGQAWSRLRLEPSLGNIAALSVKKAGEQPSVSVRVTKDELRAIRDWMGDGTEEQFRSLLRRHFWFDLVWGGGIILFPGNIFWIGTGLFSLAIAFVAYRRPRPTVYLLRGILTFLISLYFLTGMLLGVLSPWFALVLFLPLFSLVNNVASYRLWSAGAGSTPVGGGKNDHRT